MELRKTTFGNIKSIVEGFSSVSSSKEVLEEISLEQLEEMLNKFDASHVPIGAVAALAEESNSMPLGTGYSDVFEQLTLKQFDSIISRTGVDKFSLRDIDRFSRDINSILDDSQEYFDSVSLGKQFSASNLGNFTTTI